MCTIWSQNIVYQNKFAFNVVDEAHIYNNTILFISFPDYHAQYCIVQLNCLIQNMANKYVYYHVTSKAIATILRLERKQNVDG